MKTIDRKRKSVKEKEPVFSNPAYKEAYDNLVAARKRLARASREENIAFLRKIGAGSILRAHGIR